MLDERGVNQVVSIALAGALLSSAGCSDRDETPASSDPVTQDITLTSTAQFIAGANEILKEYGDSFATKAIYFEFLERFANDLGCVDIAGAIALYRNCDPNTPLGASARTKAVESLAQAGVCFHPQFLEDKGEYFIAVE
ncbi:MAG: hypothetical protein KDD53_03955, partial [Bdellovibrionales bacterium]|nr:hypothetical protein [Bdellovibrionales bacterium]